MALGFECCCKAVRKKMSVAVGAAVGDQGMPDRGVGASVLSSDMAQSPLVKYVINKKVLLLDPNEGSTFTVEDLTCYFLCLLYIMKVELPQGPHLRGITSSHFRLSR